ncbi:hypothetical protein ABT313_34500, partial [Kribbella sp. NPDC000426]
ADALGIISDPRYTQELLTQAHNHPTTTPTTATDTPADTAADTAPADTAADTAADAAPAGAAPAGAAPAGAAPADAAPADAAPAESAETAAAPAGTSTPAPTPVQRSATRSEAAPGPRPAAPDSQTGVGARPGSTGSTSTGTGPAAANSQAGTSTRSEVAGGAAFGPLDRTSDAPRSSPDPARGRSTASPANPPCDGSCNRSTDTPYLWPNPARSRSTASPATPCDSPGDCSSGAPRRPSTSADPARSDTRARPASPPYDGPNGGDTHVADPTVDPSANPVELREPPLEDGAGPYDPDPPSDPFDNRLPEYIPGPRSEPDDGVPMDASAQRALDARLAQIKRDAYANPADSANSANSANSAGRSGGQVRPGQTEVFVHLTDLTLATGTGVLRAEGIGPLLAEQLTELVGHGPYTVKPVIDLNDAVSVDAYEIPARIRERVRLTYPVELFPYGTRESHRGIDLDHIEPYDPYGPAGQTSTGNLAPLSRFAHRVKTHAHGWDVRRVDHKTLEWTTPHGFMFEVGPTGTHRLPNRRPNS